MENKLNRKQIMEIINLTKEISKEHEKSDSWAPEEGKLYMKVARNNLIQSLEILLRINNL